MLARMNRHLAPWLLAIALLALSACSTVVVEPATGQGGRHAVPVVAHTSVPGGSYAVVRGDTLYSIAFRKGVDFRDLAKWNGIAAPYTIWPGQHLRLSPPPGGAPRSHAAVATTEKARSTPAAAALSAPVFQSVPATASAPPASPHVSTATGSATVPAAHAPTVAAAPATAVSTEVPVAGEPKAAVPPPAPAVASGGSRAAGGVSWRWPADGQIIKRFTPGDAVPGIEIAGKAGDPVRAAADGVVVYSGNGLVGYGELVIIKHNDSLLSAYGHNSKRLVKEGQRVSAGQQIAEMGSSGASRVELGFQIRKDGNPVDPLNYLPAK
ncbi:peptidase M23 [Rhodanobacter sp. C06]|uniref:peptidoglycan DD-metalloendopeptidase family protein n=1 Tax=Rhodanobacter sp. C06 TaxID=1945854 RepID=UPI00098482C3|nr:peptidoglycan DD-metalloendopeptidase family protein [Rhodanobacter sp. C06]OOG43182.1 peptidase M23 [Rhodanobacter sp. C06]